MIKKCIICGAEFSAPPSDKKVTCSPQCRSERARRAATGHPRLWGDQAKAKLKEKWSDNKQELLALQKKASQAAMQIPEGQRGVQNRAAKIWTLKSPTGEIVHVTNLTHWARENAQMFEPGTVDVDATASRVHSGFSAIVSSINGTKSRKSKQAGTYKGWQLVCLPQGKKEVKMKKQYFASLYDGACEASSEDMYIAEWATSDIFDPDKDAPDPDYGAIVELLRQIYRCAHITVRETREHTGLSQAAFAERYLIPKRSVENWESGSRECPDYVRLMLAHVTGAAECPGWE